MAPFSKICMLAAVVAVTLFVVLTIFFFRSDPNFIEITIDRCDDVDRRVKMPTSLLMGPCERNDPDRCKLKANPKGLEIKAKFPEAELATSATIELFWLGKKVATGDACQAGFTCPDKEGKKEQSLDWKPDIPELKVGAGMMKIQISGASHPIAYCVQFSAQVVAQ